MPCLGKGEFLGEGRLKVVSFGQPLQVGNPPEDDIYIASGCRGVDGGSFAN
jgi:hypothetical protein